MGRKYSDPVSYSTASGTKQPIAIVARYQRHTKNTQRQNCAGCVDRTPDKRASISLASTKVLPPTGNSLPSVRSSNTFASHPGRATLRQNRRNLPGICNQNCPILSYNLVCFLPDRFRRIWKPLKPGGFSLRLTCFSKLYSFHAGAKKVSIAFVYHSQLINLSRKINCQP